MSLIERACSIHGISTIRRASWERFKVTEMRRPMNHYADNLKKEWTLTTYDPRVERFTEYSQASDIR